MKRGLRVVAIVVAVIGALLFAVTFLIDANTFKPALESRLSAALGRAVTLGDLSLSIFQGQVTAGGLTVAEDPSFGTEPFLRAESLGVGVDLKALIFDRRLNVREFVVDRPEIALIQKTGGKWNFSTLGAAPSSPGTPPATAQVAEAPAEPLQLAVQLVRISNGHVRLVNEGAGEGSPTELQDVNIELRDFSPTAAFPFSLSTNVSTGGSLKLDGKAGPIATPDASATPFTAQLSIEELALANQGGYLSTVAQALSEGDRMRVQGDATIRDLKLAKNGTAAKQPVKATFALSYDRPSQRGAIERFPLRIGGAEVNVGGTYSLAAAQPVVDLKLTGSKVPLTELAVILPALDVVIPGGATIERGTATVDLNSRGPINALVTTGTIRLDDTLLTNFSLSEKLKILERFAGIQAEAKTTIALFDAVVSATPTGTDVRNIVLRVPAVGELTGAGVVSPGHDLDFRFLTDLGNAGGSKIPLRVTGTSASPSFKLDVAGLANQTLDEIRRDPGKALEKARGILDQLRGK